MAGIVGIARAEEVDRIAQVLRRIAHRGRAGANIRSCHQATLGYTWPRAQVAWAREAHAHSVVLDGEVHNWAQLAPGAGRPLAALEKAFRARGPEFVADLDGPFALAIAGPGGIFLARDRLGKAPLYYGRYQNVICFASEVKALLGWAQGISEFPPGYYFQNEGGLRRYHQPARPAPINLPARRVAACLKEQLLAAVRKRLEQDTMGAWLSGGIDSAALTALAAGEGEQVHTFSVGLEGAPDLEYSRAVAKHLGTLHHERLCTIREAIDLLPEVIYHLESFDALLVRSSIMNFLVGRLAAEEVPAVLSGEGGDELFAGYAYLKGLDPERLPAELADITGRLHNTALQRVDRCSAAHGLVARTPFLDREVVDYASSIPAEMKIRRNGDCVEKWVLRKAVEGLLPEAIIWRPKSKFWEGAGIGERLAEHAGKLISDDQFAKERRLPNGDTLNSKEETLYYHIFRDCLGPACLPSLVGRTKGVPVTT